MWYIALGGFSNNFVKGKMYKAFSGAHDKYGPLIVAENGGQYWWVEYLESEGVVRKVSIADYLNKIL